MSANGPGGPAVLDITVVTWQVFSDSAVLYADGEVVLYPWLGTWTQSARCRQSSI
jgi:hypothetical protein